MIRGMMSGIKALGRLVLLLLFSPYWIAKQLGRGMMSALRSGLYPVSRTSTSWIWWFTREMLMVPVWVIRTFLKEIWTVAKTTYRLFLRSPRATYTKFVFYRDWIMVKVEYLQSESQKWKALFTTLKAPYSLLRAMGFSPQFATSILAAGSIAGGGVAVAEVMEPPSFERGDSGVYSAPSINPVYFEEKFNTLRLDVGSTAVGLVEITDTTLGTAYTGSDLPDGESKVIIVGGLPTVQDPAFTGTYLEVGTLIVDRWRCESLKLTNIEAHELIVHGNTSDGQSIAAVAGTPRDRGINGGNRATDMITSDSYYDQLKITAATSGVNGKIDVLRLSNLYSKGGGCIIDRVKAGTVEVTLNEIGGDSDLATKAFEIETSVIYKSFSNVDNVEVEMAVPAVQ